MNTSVFVQVKKTLLKKMYRPHINRSVSVYFLPPLSPDESEASCMDGETGFQTRLSHGSIPPER